MRLQTVEHMMGRGAGGAARTGAMGRLFGLCSGLAIVVGCWSAGNSGAAIPALVQNGLAWALGAGLAWGVARLGERWTLLLLGLPFVLLILSLLSAGIGDVHRWFAIGPERLNAAELVLPIALTVCAGLERSSMVRLVFPALVAAVTALQPDASQTAAAAAAGVAMWLTSTRPAPERCLAALACAAAVVASLLRPAPLAPVAAVEGIVLLAARLSPVLACLGVAGVAGSVAAPLFLAKADSRTVRDGALALTAYAAVAALAPLAGAFPVPLMGIAFSPILGAWLGVGGLLRATATPTAFARGLPRRAKSRPIGPPGPRGWSRSRPRSSSPRGPWPERR